MSNLTQHLGVSVVPWLDTVLRWRCDTNTASSGLMACDLLTKTTLVIFLHVVFSQTGLKVNGLSSSRVVCVIFSLSLFLFSAIFFIDFLTHLSLSKLNYHSPHRRFPANVSSFPPPVLYLFLIFIFFLLFSFHFSPSLPPSTPSVVLHPVTSLHFPFPFFSSSSLLSSSFSFIHLSFLFFVQSFFSLFIVVLFLSVVFLHSSSVSPLLTLHSIFSFSFPPPTFSPPSLLPSLLPPAFRGLSQVMPSSLGVSLPPLLDSLGLVFL